ncbi:unnamed protein product [Durusdinium trenchii]|uniref:Uncharacterized protein n=1 Tax=Durusdinium trenchii TaxID=1381693 RepID=A0ABP0K515_9DINO
MEVRSSYILPPFCDLRFHPCELGCEPTCGTLRCAQAVVNDPTQLLSMSSHFRLIAGFQTFPQLEATIYITSQHEHSSGRLQGSTGNGGSHTKIMGGAFPCRELRFASCLKSHTMSCRLGNTYDILHVCLQRQAGKI